MKMDKILKLKLVKIWEILSQETDEDHPMGTTALLSKLQEMGIECDRRTLYADIEALNECGYEILCRRSTSNVYYVKDRKFSIAEICIMMDAVQAAGFITDGETEKFIDKLAFLAGSRRGETLKDNFIAYNTTKTDNGMNTNERYISYSRALSELFYVSEPIAKTEKVIFESSSETNSDNLTDETIIKDTAGIETVSKSVFLKKEICQKLSKRIQNKSHKLKKEKEFVLELLESILKECPKDFICGEEEYYKIERFFMQEYLEYAHAKIQEILTNK